VPASANTGTRSTAPKAPTGVPEKAAAPVPEKPGARPADAPQDQRVMSVSELPPAIQQAIPRMSISVHAYSPKLQDRVVMINNRMMREGQDLAPGLRLEQITPDGMIFSFSGYRFRRGLQQSGETAEMK
jgi:general secretion pathway protein B